MQIMGIGISSNYFFGGWGSLSSLRCRCQQKEEWQPGSDWRNGKKRERKLGGIEGK